MPTLNSASGLEYKNEAEMVGLKKYLKLHVTPANPTSEDIFCISKPWYEKLTNYIETESNDMPGVVDNRMISVNDSNGGLKLAANLTEGVD